MHFKKIDELDNTEIIHDFTQHEKAEFIGVIYILFGGIMGFFIGLMTLIYYPKKRIISDQ